MFAKHMLSLGLSSGLLITFPAAGGDQPGSPARQVTVERTKVNFSNDVQPIFDSYCVVCHQTGDSEGQLNLEEGISYRELVSHASAQDKLLRIAPGKPEESYLIHKMEGTHTQVGGSGELMPDSGPLDKDLIDTIRKWILEGAKK